MHTLYFMAMIHMSVVVCKQVRLMYDLCHGCDGIWLLFQGTSQNSKAWSLSFVKCFSVLCYVNVDGVICNLASHDAWCACDSLTTELYVI